MIGCGNMGGAILQAWLDNGLSPENVTIVKPSQSELPGGKISQPDYPADGPPDLVLLAMKPHQLGEVTEELAPLLGSKTNVISILAGTELDVLHGALPAAGAIVRLMPNMAVTVGKSPMIMIGKDIGSDLHDQMDALFSPLGPPEWLENEEQMHIATALAGSGPAFLFRFIDALTVSAHELGMDKEQAGRLALKMVEGAAMLTASSEHDPGTLANQVASPNGVTRKGLDVLDAGGRLNALLKDVLKAAMQRNKEMAKEAKK
ncbi:pyrroline-5-carboxylate reductase [Parasphingorhabdus halotolerans]|uniref:Pyrroline-5-carboxylate reductase n=2 Tax=Parasphingorhabdus halotolerans TaxID=2725558 RepID=A0A6H2DQE8_9SPHN|nr:pyrroline-5-carboxylate reductase [Parasphingorhabdus halotolerans]